MGKSQKVIAAQWANPFAAMLILIILVMLYTVLLNVFVIYYLNVFGKDKVTSSIISSIYKVMG